MTGTDLLPAAFNYSGHQVRTVAIEGEPWFVLGDLTAVLEIKQYRTDRLDKDVIRSHTLQTAGGPQKVTLVNESGMYEVVIRSDKPEAAAFRRWITSEVLPSIRKTGSYGQPAPKELSRMEILQYALEAEQELQRTQLALEASESTVAELEPKAAIYDRFLSGKGNMTLTQVAKIIGYGVKDFNKMLREDGILYQSTKTVLAKQSHIDRGYFITTAGVTTLGYNYTQTYVTPAGFDFLSGRYGLEQAA